MGNIGNKLLTIDTVKKEIANLMKDHYGMDPDYVDNMPLFDPGTPAPNFTAPKGYFNFLDDLEYTGPTS
jgi:hypothetical protein